MIVHHNTLAKDHDVQSVLPPVGFQRVVPNNGAWNSSSNRVFTFGNDRDVSYHEQLHAEYIEHKIPTK
jgi:hypothetical protein